MWRVGSGYFKEKKKWYNKKIDEIGLDKRVKAAQSIFNTTIQTIKVFDTFF